MLILEKNKNYSDAFLHISHILCRTIWFSGEMKIRKMKMEKKKPKKEEKKRIFSEST